MQLTNHKIINCFLLTIILAVLATYVAYDLMNRGYMLTTGDDRMPITQKPFYGFMRVPGTGLQLRSSDVLPENIVWHRLGMISSLQRRTVLGALGADFSQVYFSAMALRHGESQYNPADAGFRDRFGRKPNYPPYANRLYIPLTYLAYHDALIVHNYGSLLVFLLLSALMLKAFGLRQYIIKSVLLLLLLYFYTPLGSAHFERGQFDLWIASSYLLIFASVFLKKRDALSAAASGVLAAIKWSSVPFIGTFSVMAFLGSGPGKRWVFLIPGGLMVMSAIVFFRELQEYWPSLRIYEFQARTFGVSFMYLMPKGLAKSLQIISCMLVIALFFILCRDSGRRPGLLKTISFPFALTMFIQGMCYGTISYEYRIVSLFGLVPAFLIWTADRENVPAALKGVVALLLALFITGSFRLLHFMFYDLPTLEAPGMTLFYLVSSLFCLAVTCYLMYLERDKKVTSP